jgi:hypothetical protein
MHLCAALAVLLAPSAPQTWNFKTDTAPTVVVDNLAGAVSVVSGAPGEVAVEARIEGGDEADRARWTLDVKGDRNRVQVRACPGPCDHGTHSGELRSHVLLTLRVPRPAALQVNTVSADVLATGLAGAVQIHTVSGDATIKASGAPVTIHSVSGDTRVAGTARLEGHSVSGKLDWEGACGAGCSLQAHSVSGEVSLRFAPESSFALAFATTSGDFRDHLRTTIRASGRRQVEAQFGKGEGVVQCSTVSGDLEVGGR